MKNIRTVNQAMEPGKNAWYSVGVYDLGLHILFLGTAVMLMSSRTAYRESSVLMTIGSLILLWGALGKMQKRWSGVRIPLTVWIAAIIMPIVIMVLVVAVVQNPTVYYYKPMRFFPYFWILIALGGVDEEEWARLMRAFRIHALVGTALFVAMMMLGYSWQYSGRESFFKESVAMGGVLSRAESPLFWSRKLMYSYPVLLILLPQEKMHWRVVGVAATLGMATWAILGQFRSVLVLGVGLSVMFAFYSWQRARAVRLSHRVWAIVILAACVLGGWQFLMHGESTQAEVLQKAWSQFTDRLFGGRGRAGVDSTLENVRFTDARYYVSTLTVPRLIMGDGGRWTSPTGVVMHVGHFLYIIHGGLFMLIVAWLLVYWHGWWGIVLSRRLSVLAAASVAAMHSIQAIPAGMLLTVPSSALLFICAGYCWHSMAVERTNRLKGQGRMPGDR